MSAALQLPEGAAKNFTFAWVCDAKGGLYLSVNKEHMITCGLGTIDLSQTLKIQGAKPVSLQQTQLSSFCLSAPALYVVSADQQQGQGYWVGRAMTDGEGRPCSHVVSACTYVPVPKVPSCIHCFQGVFKLC
jgi:hypothetical protein